MGMDKVVIRACEPRCCFAYISESYCQRCNAELGPEPDTDRHGIPSLDELESGHAEMATEPRRRELTDLDDRRA